MIRVVNLNFNRTERNRNFNSVGDIKKHCTPKQVMKKLLRHYIDKFIEFDHF